MKLPIYLDYNATTPIAEEVLDRMRPVLTERFGNPSSHHAHGWAAEAAVDVAREELCGLIGASPDDLIFTGGATESVNTVLKSTALRHPGGHIVTAGTEHKAVLDGCRGLERVGNRLSVLQAGRNGIVEPEAVEAAIQDDTCLIALMWANNETGVVGPIRSYSALARSRGIPLLVDATQAVGKIPVDAALADYLALSAHKFYGPKGIGALYVHPSVRGRLVPLLEGGGQQGGLRGGTLNVPGIVGLGAAADVARRRLEGDGARWLALRSRLEHGVLEAVPTAVINGSDVMRLPQTSSITFVGLSASDLIGRMTDIAVSSASACQSGSGKPSHVLLSMGATETEASATVRFSLGRPTTAEDVDAAIRSVRLAISVPAASAAP